MTIIELKNVAKSYKGVKAVKEISFKVEKGEIFAILGSSGSGKSTILRLIAGLEAPDHGEIIIEGKTVAVSNGLFVPPEKRNVGMVFQDYTLFPHLNVKGNIAFALNRLNGGAREKIVGRMLEFIGLKGFENRYSHQISGGEQQRVALARAMAPSPVVVLLDEPFSSLDEELRAYTRDETQRILKKAHATAIIVTHNQEEAFAIADHVAVMNHGRIEQIDSPDNIYHLPATRFVADFVGQADFIDGVVKDMGITTEIGIFTSSVSLPDGTEVQIMIRPEDIAISPDEKGTAEVVRRYFKGSENLYCLKLPSGTLIHSSAPSTLIIKPAARVRVEPIPSHIVVFIGGMVVKEDKERKEIQNIA